ncbi:MAG TPA: carboxypeptidase-like regulatory domain-containing protein [Candidatus Dormibacteraeota bacterium]|nr:carboxypeptidase-like regulatory domain-containing protein [Candidatus Dormibacteraeota bacterium]
MLKSTRIYWVLLYVVVAASGSVWVPAPIYAQASSSGTVVGQVTDPTGAVVGGATVSLIDNTTGTTKATTTNDAGRYIFVNVNPGTYDITVEKAGFAQAKFAQQEVSLGQQLTVNAALKVGSTTEQVVVEASGATLQTLNATVGTTIGFQNLQELPNLSRDVSSLLTLQPAISPNGSVAGAVRDQNTFQLDGGNNSSDMDGTQNTYTPSFASTTTGGGPTGVMPTPVESIEEFKVNVSNQTADFNGSSGAQVQLVTRRGGKSWHGAVYEYYLGSNFGANTWLNNHTSTLDAQGKVLSPSTKLISNHYNRFGASAGGPVGPSFWGGRTYVFANYEGRRYPQNTQVLKRVPSARLRLGLITDTVAPKGVYNINAFPVVDPVTGATIQPAPCPSSPNKLCDPRGVGLNPLVKQLWDKYMPLPNDLSSAAGDGVNTQGYLTGLKLPQNDNFGVVRLDHDFGANWHFMSSYRYYHLERFTNNQYDVGGLLGGKFGVATSTSKRPQVPWFFVVGVTTNISHNLTNDFRYNYLRNFWEWTTASAVPQLPGLGGAMEIGGEGSSGGIIGCNALIPYCVRTQDTRQRYWNGHDHVFRDDLTLIHGNHLFQFGGQYQRNWNAHQRNDNGLGIMAAYVYQIGASTAGSSAVSGLNINGFVPAGFSSPNNWRNLYAQVLGIVTQPQTLYSRKSPDMTLEPFGSPVIAHSITPSYNVYFSDTWHMRPNFTLTYGLGYQLEMPPYEVDGKQVMVVDSAGNPIRAEDYLASRKRAALAGQVYNPTLGFATIRNVGGGRKYPYEPFYGGFSPRISGAWNPRFDTGILGSLFGQNKTVVRGGWGLTYGRMNGVINILTPLLAPGLLQAVSCQGAVNAASAQGGNQCLGTGRATPVTAFRIGAGQGLDGLAAPLPPAAQTLPQPFLPGTSGCSGAGCVNTTYFPKSGDASALDPSYRPSKVHSFDLTIQRELTSKISVEVGYVGRLISHELVDLDINAVPYMTTAAGQSFAEAYAALYTSVCGLNGPTCANNNMSKTSLGQLWLYTGPAQPFFEQTMGGPSSAFCAGFSSCTAALASPRNPADQQKQNPKSQFSNLQVGAAYSLWTSLSSEASWTLGRTLPDSIVPGTSACPAGSPVCSQVTSVGMSLSNGYGNYHAAFGTVRLRDWHGIAGLANFTWGRALGTGATTQSTSGYTVVDPWDLQAMYGPQSYDILFLFNSGLVYHLPFFKSQQGVLGHVLGGWGLAPLFTAQSGFPQQVDVNSDCQSFGESSCSTSTNENAILIGSIPRMSSHRNVTVSGTGVGSGGNTTGLNAYADPQAVYSHFRRLVLGVDHSAGGAGRIRGFPRWNMDLSFTKETKISEHVGIGFYALMSNFFNHFQPSDPTTCLDNDTSTCQQSQWGVIRGQAYDPRQMEFGLRLHF